MTQYLVRDQLDMMRRDELIAIEPGAGARAAGQRDARARRAAEATPAREGAVVALRLARGLDQIDDVAEQFRVQVERSDRPAHGEQLLLTEPLGRGDLRMLLFAGVQLQDAEFLVAGRIGDHRLHQEAVELGLGQVVGAFLLDRILGRQHHE